MKPAQYRLTEIRAFYRANLALEVDELTIASGRLHILAGPNGSGKSTLLSILAFLMKPSHGEVVFAGTQVDWQRKQLASLRKRVTLLHQHSFLFSGTVSANVAFGPRARGMAKEEVQRAVRESLAMVALDGFESRDARHLSGGEARRVALARALACQPEVLLLDEPMAHVDKASAQIIERLVVSLSGQGTTVVMSSHNEQLGQRTESKVIRLLDGKVEKIVEGNGETPSRVVDGYHYAKL
jgi:tungstate transport system ATP-binding protein